MILALCSLALALSGCRAQSATAEPAPVSVKVKAVELNADSGGVRYAANIEPRKQIELAFKVGGYVDHLLQVRGVDGRMRDLQEGDVVTKGAILARVRQSDYAVKVSQAESQASEAESALESSRAQFSEAQSAVTSSQAQLVEAEAALKRARLDFDRARNLFSTHSLTKTDFDAAESQFNIAEAKRNAALSQVGMLEAKANAAGSQIEMTRARIKGAQALVAEATIPIQDTALKAPLNSIVLQKTVEAGTLVSPGKAVFVLADMTSVKAVFGVADQTVGKLKLGSPLSVTTEVLPGQEFLGQITRISPAADPKSRVFEVEVSIPNQRQILRSGLIASLFLAESEPFKPVPVVPLSSIVRFNAGKGHGQTPDSYAVFVVEQQGGRKIARSRQVKLGEAFGNTIAVLEGLGVGEQVISIGASLAKDGQPVHVIP